MPNNDQPWEDADWTASRGLAEWESASAKSVADWGAEFSLADWTIPPRDAPTD